MTNDIEAAFRKFKHAQACYGADCERNGGTASEGAARDRDEAEDALLKALAHAARGEGEVDRLARFIMENIPGEPSKSEGAVDCAIRLLSRPTPPPATGEAKCPRCGVSGRDRCVSESGLPATYPHAGRAKVETGARGVTPADLARSLDAVAAMIDGTTSLDNVARIQRERDEAQKVLTDLLAYIEREHGTDADEGMCDEDDPCDMAVLIKRARAALGLALPASRDASNPGEKEER